MDEDDIPFELIPHRAELLQRMRIANPSLSKEHADLALATTWDKDKHASDKDEWLRKATEWVASNPDDDDEDC